MTETSTSVSARRRVHYVATPRGRLHVNDFAGSGPPIVMTHGFPDDSRIYGRLIPELGRRRVVIFDFLGYGGSDRADGADHLMPGEHEAELGAVIDALELDHPVLVGHDAGGPVVIDWAVDNPDRVGGLVLLNTYYGNAPTLRFPEMIRLLADSDLAPLAEAILSDPQMRNWLLAHTGGRFGIEQEGPDSVAQASVVPQFFGDDRQGDALRAVRAWTAELFVDLALQDHRVAGGQVASLHAPVVLAFGVDDLYLNVEVAQHLAAHFSHATVMSIDGASHWPQWDQPRAAAAAVLAVAESAEPS